eukprot:gene4813-6743_t
MEEVQEDQDMEEINHWYEVMRTFLFYSDFFSSELGRRQNHINMLPEKYVNRLPDVTFSKLKSLHDCSLINQTFFDKMVRFHAHNSFMSPPSNRPLMPDKNIGPIIPISQQHRNQAVLHSYFREWSKEGEFERNQSFSHLVNELKLRIPINKSSQRYQYRVLVPGCGLGRLPLEIAGNGYCCEGNEYSAFMAIASNFVLNGIKQRESFEIYPWISNICNIVNINDTLQGIKIPDISSLDILDGYSSLGTPKTELDGEYSPEPIYPPFSMSAGNFVEVYGTEDNKDAWDAVVTCFFIDTAPVVLEYIDVINYMLKPGGVWINLGPLLYHWVADTESNHDERFDQSVELSFEELKYVIEGYGLQFVNENFIDCQYSHCTTSMMKTEYRAKFFTVIKPLNPA